MLYITADFHFRHDRIFDFECYSLFKTHEERNGKIFNTWRQTVNKNDTVIVAGDFGFLNNEEAILFQKLPGRKILIKGNHDKHSEEYYKKRYGFAEVSSVPIFLNKRVVVSHIPIPVEAGTLNIHGHLHNSILNLENYKNTNIHVCDYNFISDKFIKKWLSSHPKNNYYFLEEWFAQYYQFTSERDDVIYDENKNILLDETIKNKKDKSI